MKSTNTTPPRLAQRLLTWLLREDLAEEVLGDLEEKFFAVAEKQSITHARLDYWYQVLHYLRPFALQKSEAHHTNSITMFRYYFKISWRNLLKQKVYSFIKIGGFALGIAAALMIALFIYDELSYDQHYQEGERIYRVVNVSSHPEHEGNWVAFPPPIKSALEHEFPEIEQVGRFINSDWFDAGENQVRPMDKVTNSYEKDFVYVDPEMLDILEVSMVYGDRQTALAKPNTVVISRRKAEKYFPGENPVGKRIVLNDDMANPYEIGGVMENYPNNTHFQYDFLLTLTGKEFWPGEQTSWGSWNYATYVKTKPGTNAQALEEKLLVIRDEYVIEHMKSRGDQRIEEMKQYMSYWLQPVGDIHLRSGKVHDNLPHGDIRIVWLFGAVAGFILLLACINFINLSTARSANRAKEVGLQKVLGSHKLNIIRQFLTESFLYTILAFILGVVLVWVTLPFFNSLANKTLQIPWNEWWLVPGLFLFVIIISLLSGLYPSFFLSSFRPIQVIRGNLSRGSKSSVLRGSLVVFQFATSIVLIICTFITSRQMDFILNKKIGFDKEKVVMLHGANTLGEQQESFKNELLRLSEVKDVSYSNYLPVEGTMRDGNSFWKEGRQKEDMGITAQKWYVDEDYINTMGMKLVSGRNFNRGMASDSTALIVNQSMVREFGFEDPIGKRITNGFQPTFHIIGVVEDFHFSSLRQEIGPLSFAFGQSGSIATVKIQADDMGAALAAVNQTWDEFMPNQPIRYTFLDDTYAEMYGNVARTGRVFTVFSVLAIIVACLGLFGLSAFMVEQRGKEISIRKVLGASLASIFSLLTTNFIKLILIALIIAVPVGWYMMKQWLNDYAYRIEITWDVFVMAGVTAVLIAILTISAESLKAGLANPAKNLRSE